MAARDLAWEGCLNVRDLGGVPTEDGVATRFGAVVRSDTPAHLSDAGWEALVGYGVSRIVDLRRDDERADDPPRRAGVEVVHVSLMEGMEPGQPGWEDVAAAAAAAGDDLAAHVVYYAAALERCRPAVARALDAVADAPPGAVLVHCVGGKDRTGLVAALLLRLAGVALDLVDADYALTEQRLRARLGADAASPAGAVRTVLGELEREHGTIADYLVACGLAAETVERLRARLRG